MPFLSPDVTEILVDPDLGGGLPFTVFRKITENTRAGGVPRTETYTEIGNIQPATSYDLQLVPEEHRADPTIVIRSTFGFQMGSNDGTGAVQTDPDEVVAMGKRWKINRLDDWSAWGFTTAYFTLVKGGDVNGNA